MTRYVPLFPAYLRGIETRSFFAVAIVLFRSQPTYEGLKPGLDGNACLVGSGFPAYLRGIETRTPPGSLKGAGPFPAYLRGIETRGVCCCENSHCGSSQPTYEGLKRRKGREFFLAVVVFPAYLRGIETVVLRTLSAPVLLVPSLPTRD